MIACHPVRCPLQIGSFSSNDIHESPRLLHCNYHVAHRCPRKRAYHCYRPCSPADGGKIVWQSERSAKKMGILPVQSKTLTRHFESIRSCGPPSSFARRFIEARVNTNWLFRTVTKRSDNTRAAWKHHCCVPVPKCILANTRTR